MDATKLAQQIAFRIDQAADAVGLSESQIRRAIRDGRLKARKEGRAVVIRRRDLESFVDRLEVRRAGRWLGAEGAKALTTRHLQGGTSSPIGKSGQTEPGGAAPSAQPTAIPWNRE